MTTIHDILDFTPDELAHIAKVDPMLVGELQVKLNKEQDNAE